MNWQQAIDSLQAIMYNDPWTDFSKIHFMWERVQRLEEQHHPWIPVMRIDGSAGGYPVVVGPTATGKLIAFYKQANDHWKQSELTQEIRNRDNWCLFPWCVIGEPYEVSDVFKASLWKQQPGIWRGCL